MQGSGGGIFSISHKYFVEFEASYAALAHAELCMHRNKDVQLKAFKSRCRAFFLFVQDKPIQKRQFANKINVKSSARKETGGLINTRSRKSDNYS